MDSAENSKASFSTSHDLFPNFESKIHAFVEEPFELCRLCARNAKKTIYVFGDSGDMQHLEFKINAYLPVTIKSTDLLPKQLCFTCVKKLNMISEFVEDCVKAEEKLKNNAKTNFFSNQNLFQSYENKINTFAEEPFETCRLCAKNAKKIIYIFDDTGSMQQLEFKINAHLPITVKMTDLLPKQLCLTCVKKLNMLSEFVEDCTKAEEKLKNCAKENLFRSHIVSVGEDLVEEKRSSFPSNTKNNFGNTCSVSHKQSTWNDKEFQSNLFDDKTVISCFTCPLCSLGIMTETSAKVK
ncbi:uncharacterized protein LOC126267116 isoform X2 [Schistocerca gregaria]|uniref:uncharacterized protein LOC126267116 isoform X2 n=1 Tax=Schistocerca gregaria TaxID=7010 RepID=UPI00211E5B03|nr:uncharacterized protein LOC126267116 isoform X2 [Schistocerca gregaria]